jgi:hypothetical protein
MSKAQIENTSHTSTSTHQEYETQLWRMRWFVLIVISIGFLASIAASIIIKNTLLLAGMLIIRPIVRYLFSQNNK